MKQVRTYFSVFAFAASLTFGISAYAETTAVESVENAGNKAVDATKEAARDVKDKTCEMIDGKMQCLGKKVANKAKTAVDKTKTKAKEVEKKVN